MRYFIGSYSVILYAALIQLVKDGTSINGFNKLSDVHNYNGFGSQRTRVALLKLNSFYDELINYDATMIDVFEKVFFIVKYQVVGGKTTDNITKQLPQMLTTTMSGPK